MKRPGTLRAVLGLSLLIVALALIASWLGVGF
jgi:hypothetical protein